METSNVILLVAGSFGLPAIAVAIYKVFFHKDTEPLRRDLQDLKERHQDEEIQRNAREIDDLKKKYNNNLYDTNKKHQEFELKFIEMAGEFKSINVTMKNIERQLTEIINHNKTSKIN